MNKRAKLLLPLLLILPLCCMLAACSPADKQKNTPLETDPAVKTTAAKPSAGVGRYDENAQPHNITICIDPGHGFDDSGSSSDLLPGVVEKDLTLLFADLVKDKLEQLGYTVVLTHDDVSFPQEFNLDNNNKYKPEERTAYANSLDIDYFVSLHCDTYEGDASIGGTRIYYCESDRKKQFYSANVAESIKMRLDQTFPEAKEVAVHNMKVTDSYYVVRETYAAASLIEIGFITNAEDVKKLSDADWQKRFSVAVAEGIDDYFTSDAEGDI